MNNYPLEATTGAKPKFVPFDFVSQDAQGPGLAEHWAAVRKHRRLIIALALVAALLAAIYAYTLAPTFRSTAVVLIEPSKARLLSIEDVYSGSSTERGNYLTQVEILKSREVSRRAVEQLRLWEVEEFDPRRTSSSWSESLAVALRVTKPRLDWTERELIDASTDAFMASTLVEPVRLSSLVRVSFDSKDRELAARAANALVKTYVDIDRESRASLSQDATGWLQSQIQALRTKLTQSEQALQTYREKNGLISLSGSSQTVAGQQVNDFNQRLAEARARRLELEASVRQAEQAAGGDIANIPSIARSPGVFAAKQSEQLAQAKLADLSERYGSQHFSVLEAENQLRQARSSVAVQVQAALNVLRREYDAARSTERSLGDAVATARSSVQDVNRQEFRLAELEREVEANKQLYEMLVTRAKETSVGSESQGAIARVVDTALTSRVPVKPQKAQIIFAAALAGLVLGTLAAAMFERLDTSLRGAGDVEARLRQPVLASLPPLKSPDADKAEDMFLERPQSVFAEAIRTARTSVLLSYVDTNHKVLLVTSSMLSEGKTTLCTNLAMAHAQARRTLLIDADMRRPRVAQRLGLPASAKGLSNLVSGTASLRECMHFVKRANLWVMPVGDVPPNPLELLLSQRFRECLTALTQQFEVVLIDSPPVELVSDALVLAPLVSGVIYVVKAKDTPHSLARDGIVKVQRAGGSLLGVILNQAESNEARGRYAGTSGAANAYYGDSSYAYPPGTPVAFVDTSADTSDRSTVK